MGYFRDCHEDSMGAFRELVINEHGRLAKLDFRITVEVGGATMEATFPLGEHRVSALIRVLQDWREASRQRPEEAEDEPVPSTRPMRRARGPEPLPDVPLFEGEPEHCSLCGEAGHTHDDHWIFAEVERLGLRTCTTAERNILESLDALKEAIDAAETDEAWEALRRALKARRSV